MSAKTIWQDNGFIIQLLNETMEKFWALSVHEIVHLHERNHTSRFCRIIGRVVPDLQERKEELGQKRPEMILGTDENKTFLLNHFRGLL